MEAEKEEEEEGARAPNLSPNMTPPPTPPPTSLEIGFWERALLHWGEMSEGIIGVVDFFLFRVVRATGEVARGRVWCLVGSSWGLRFCDG